MDIISTVGKSFSPALNVIDCTKLHLMSYTMHCAICYLKHLRMHQIAQFLSNFPGGGGGGMPPDPLRCLATCCGQSTVTPYSNIKRFSSFQHQSLSCLLLQNTFDFQKLVSIGIFLTKLVHLLPLTANNFRTI